MMKEHNKKNKNEGKRNQFLGLLLASVFGGSIALGGFLFFSSKPTVYQTVQQTAPAAQQSKYTAVGNSNQGINFVEAAAVTRPAVVHVKTYKEIEYSSRQYVDPMEFFFRDFFGQQQRPQQQKPKEETKKAPEERPMGFGSGVIISQDGYIVTNNHVIDNADKIEVVLDDKRTFIADVIGTDPTTDLALLKVGENDLPFVNFGKSDDIQIGEWVLAVGNPFNLTSTVTAGIVSAKARNINIIQDKNGLGIESFIQTDAAVNPGNSGGALVNLKGDLIGINTAIQSQTGSFAGYAFAIPSTLAQKVVGDLKEFGMVQRGLLGVSILPLTSELAEEKGIDNLSGVYVKGVGEKSAAAEADLEEGDVITKINNVKVNSPSQLQEQVARYRPGNEIAVTYMRDAKEATTNVTLKNKQGSTAMISKEYAEFTSRLGATLVAAGEDVLEELDIENGVVVSNLTYGKLRNAGIREGFIITGVDKTQVKKPEDVYEILKKKTGGVMFEGFYYNGKHAFYAFEWKNSGS